MKIKIYALDHHFFWEEIPDQYAAQHGEQLTDVTPGQVQEWTCVQGEYEEMQRHLYRMYVAAMVKP